MAGAESKKGTCGFCNQSDLPLRRAEDRELEQAANHGGFDSVGDHLTCTGDEALSWRLLKHHRADGDPCMEGTDNIPETVC